MTSDPILLVGRIAEALTAAADVLRRFDRETIQEHKKSGGDPVTEADVAVDAVLRGYLQEDGEGWLSEETADDSSRLDSSLVWIVDPLDGTREFIDGLPEFCTSVAAVVDGVPLAGGIVNTAANVEVIGAQGVGVMCNGRRVTQPVIPPLETIRVLASRSEFNRGQWSVVEAEGIRVKPMGSVAYKLGRVAAGMDHLTWTPVPKHEWDVAGGAALMAASGGATFGLDGEPLAFNQDRPWLSGVIALPRGLETQLTWVRSLVRRQLDADRPTPGH
ncbi:MAG TPA: 3'(2'),5'-bisphosphate nucleotidase CysQ [Acidimicrobiia bacterium]